MGIVDDVGGVVDEVDADDVGGVGVPVIVTGETV
jgi:hypothetical protein